jgi:serine/threonine-protein kinase RsbW
LRGLGIEAGLGGGALGRIEVCVSEAVSNCMEHAYGGQPGHPIAIEWTPTAEDIRVAVCDRGMPLDVAQLDRVDLSVLEVDPEKPESFRPRGRGLALIKALAAQVQYRSEGDTNRLIMWISRNPRGEP